MIIYKNKWCIQNFTKLEKITLLMNQSETAYYQRFSSEALKGLALNRKVISINTIGNKENNRKLKFSRSK